ncbi:MAG: hypothetical protein HKO64_06715 [Xanthomonadales bacterium]|nr:hypothetical protein [Gammaproteobacteria bacterium]NNE06030.1 hypothetical protein [Xanthomonadales bacterium]NNL95299.1 hypothetical protein [Xanthomonadales bacterium]
MQTVKHVKHGAELALESCPEPVQVMPPQSAQSHLPLAVSVSIDALVVALLLGGLLTMPAWIMSVLP